MANLVFFPILLFKVNFLTTPSHRWQVHFHLPLVSKWLVTRKKIPTAKLPRGSCHVKREHINVLLN